MKAGAPGALAVVNDGNGWLEDPGDGYDDVDEAGAAIGEKLYCGAR